MNRTIKTSAERIIIFAAIFFFILNFPLRTLASIADGTIDSVYKYAWSASAGWINFGTSEGNVHITDSVLTGYAWTANYGWINLGPVKSGVTNNSQGTLSGYAWGEKLGWINFSGVVINSSGEFTGSASNDISGTISFDCTNCKVKTDWRPQRVRPQGGGILGSAGGGASVPEPRLQTISPAGVITFFEKIPEILASLIPEFLGPKPQRVGLPKVPIEELVPKQAPLALSGRWNLIPQSVERFVLAPLPGEITKLAEKFPELGRTMKKVGITKITDIEKLKTVSLTLPGLTESLGPEGIALQATLRGKLVLPKAIPIAKLSSQMKQQIPSEILFAKTGGELIDFNIALTIDEKGETQQKISTISGKPLHLVIKPDKPVKSIKGYVVFKSKTARQVSFQISSGNLAASLLFNDPVLAKPQEKPVRVEEKLVLLEFEYTDPDGDGIYTAEIDAPVVDGEYEIITVMDYKDPQLATREMRMITVVDPEGYVFEKEGDRETRIPGAIVSLFWLNPETKQYQLWPAKEYQQENPQTTDVRGTYSFLVPEGFYYLKVETPGYLIYDGKPFQVKEGSGVHVNIELKTKYWWLKIVDWKTVLLVAVVLLLLYNFYKDKIRDKLLNKKI